MNPLYYINFKKFQFIVVIVLMVFIFNVLTSAVSSAATNHWFTPVETQMLTLGLIDPDNQFYQGDGFKESELVNFLNRNLSDFRSEAQITSETELTRSEMINLLLKHLDLIRFTSKSAQIKSSFVDVSKDVSSVEFALRFNWISLNATRTFRPDQIIKKEEAYAILYNVYKTYSSKFEDFHSYYAINPYSQIHLSEKLNTLSFGWSRLELNKEKSDVILNLTRVGTNEYSVPSGYSTVLNMTDTDVLSRQLMIFVQDIPVFDDSLGKNVSLTEAILANESWRQSVVNQIVATIKLEMFKDAFDGVLIDFEGLKGETNASNFNLFLKELSGLLKQDDYTLYVAVHPTGLNPADYYNGYDFKAIGSYADRVILMAHDYNAKRLTALEMASGYTVTPLTPINEIFYALSNITHPETGVQDHTKVMLQFSMDSAQWKLKDDKVLNQLPYHPLYASIKRRIDEGATINYSMNLQSPYITYDDPVDGTYNVIWYENESSIEAKIELAKLFGIGGLSVWRLGTIPNIEEHELDIWSKLNTHIK